jgi:cell division septum initiation protein DivIVA
MNDITNKTTKVNLRGLLRLDDVEDLLERLMERVDMQAKEIDELKTKSLFYASADKVTEGFSDAQKMLRNLSVKVFICHFCILLPSLSLLIK